MISLGSIQFASAWVLAFLLLLPIWWLIRRKRRAQAIVFSRVSVLAAGPRAGRATTLALFVSAQPAARVDDRRAVAAARRCARGGRDERRHQHRAGDRSLELDARAGLSAAESTRGRQGRREAVHLGADERSHRRRGVRRRGADAGAVDDRLSGRERRGRQSGRGAARGRNRDRHGDRDRGEPAARCTRTVARDDRAHGRREQSRRDRSAHGGESGRGVRDQDLHDRRRHRGHGSGAGRSWAVRTSLREPSGADRRAAARRHREDHGRPVLPRARRRGVAAHLRRDQPARARAGADAVRTCATRSSFAGRSISRRSRSSSSSCWPLAGGRCHERNRIRLSVSARARRAAAVAGDGRASSRVPAAQGASRAPRQHGRREPAAAAEHARAAGLANGSARAWRARWSASPSPARAGARSERPFGRAASTWCSRSTRRCR